jgi:capsid protein
MRLFSRPAPAALPVRAESSMVRARFDNQLSTEENRQLWAMADAMSVDASANAGVRRILRMRGRYAYHNNPFVGGAANRLAKFVVGSGPKLHLATDDPETNDKVEASFNRWFERVEGPRKLRVSRTARFYNGEGFNVLRTNPRVKHPVKLDLHEIEADQVASPLFGIFPSQFPDQWFDGVVLDRFGNRETYHVLRQHPGAFGLFLTLGYEFDPVPAQFVLHDYCRMRPAQQRGIPEVTPALDLFEEARRYRKAVLAAAETAADHAGFIKSDAPADAGPDISPDTGFGTNMDYVQVKRRMMGVLPAGWDAFQMKAEQPVQGYDQYLLSLLVEASQVLDMPLFILTGDARLANMSSAYVATQSFIKSVNVDRQEYGTLMDQVLDEWLAEARSIPGLIPAELPDDPNHSWRWDRVATHADPGKMANAQGQRIKNGTRSLSIEAADDGLELEEIHERAAADFGVSVKEYKAALFKSIFAQPGAAPGAAGVAPAPTDPTTDVADPEEGDETDDGADPVTTDDEDQ